MNATGWCTFMVVSAVQDCCVICDLELRMVGVGVWVGLCFTCGWGLGAAVVLG